MHGIDYDETFAPVAKMATLRTLLVVSVAKRWVLHHMDVKNAFLHGSFEDELYMYQPQGFEGKKHPEYVCKLKLWTETSTESMAQRTFKIS